MKKQFINPAVRVIKFDSEGLMNQTSPTVNDNLGNGEPEAPERQRLDIFGDSEF